MKICISCKKEKLLINFGKHSRSKDGLQSKCKQCKREYDNKYHETRSINQKNNKVVKQTERKKILTKKIAEIKIQKGCIDCGYNKHPSALQFDHQGNKEFNISDMLRRGHSLDNILLEINKCEVRCANCHSIKTSIDFSWYK